MLFMDNVPNENITPLGHLSASSCSNTHFYVSESTILGGKPRSNL